MNDLDKKRMIYSTNINIVGKATRQEDGFYCNGHKVSLGYGWDNIIVSWDEAFDLITVDGFPVACALTSNNRKIENFKSHCLALVDIDKGMTITDLLNDPFYNEFGAGFYTTPSHTMDDQRFRIIFRSESPIVNAEKMRNLLRALMKQYGYADESCKDAARLFYGTKDCVLKEKTENILPDFIVTELVKEIEDADAASINNDTTNYAPLNDESKKKIVDLLKQSYVGEYTTWRNIGWAMKTSGFELADFQYVTTGMMSKKTAKDAQNLWNDQKPTGRSPTMGTIVYFLKQRYGENCLYTPQAKQQDIMRKIKQGEY